MVPPAESPEDPEEAPLVCVAAALLVDERLEVEDEVSEAEDVEVVEVEVT